MVKARIEQAFPDVQVELIARSSRGDQLSGIPLHTVEGQDFFTQDIFDALSTHEADIAVHSLKDMSSTHFFGEHLFAVVDRDDIRDLAIFNPGVPDESEQIQARSVSRFMPFIKGIFSRATPLSSDG